MNTRKTDYGDFPIGRDDIRETVCCTLDLRQTTGGWEWRKHSAEDAMHTPGHPFQLSVFATPEGEVPVAEVLIVHDNQVLSIVGAATGRPGVVEVTPDHLRAAVEDGAYRGALLAYIGGAAS